MMIIESMLWKSCEEGYFNNIKNLSEKGFDLNTKNSNGDTPLHVAVKNRNFEIVEFLVFTGIEKEPVNNQGITPLCIACELGYLNISQFLIVHGCKKKDREDNSPCFIAANNGHWDIVKFFIKRGFNINTVEHGFTLLYIAILHNNTTMIKFLKDTVSTVCDSNRVTNVLGSERSQKPSSYSEASDLKKITSCNTLHYGITHLMIACMKDIEDLSSFGDVNGKSFTNLTALHIAAFKGNIEHVQYLLSKGAYINVTETENGFTPLHMATISGNLEIVKIFLEKSNWSRNSVNHLGMTCLDIAYSKNYTELVAFFKEKQVKQEFFKTKDSIQNYTAPEYVWKLFETHG